LHVVEKNSASYMLWRRVLQVTCCGEEFCKLYVVGKSSASYMLWGRVLQVTCCGEEFCTVKLVNKEIEECKRNRPSPNFNVM
jgi:hypothetical protein